MDRNPDATRPFVTVITPAFNAQQYIAETLDSVLAQTYDNFEIVVADDGSTDRTAEIVKERYPQARFFWQPNGGQPAARNLGLRHARGDMVASSNAIIGRIPMGQHSGVVRTRDSDSIVGKSRDGLGHSRPMVVACYL